MKRFKILLLTVLICLCQVNLTFAANDFLKDGKYWTEDTYNPWFGGVGTGLMGSSYTRWGNKYASPTNGHLNIVIKGNGNWYHILTSQGVSYTVTNEHNLNYIFSNLGSGSYKVAVYQIELSNVSGAGKLTLKKDSNVKNNAAPEYLYVYINHPKESHNYTYQSDANYHWGTCGCGATTGKQGHTDVNGKCSVCGRILHTHNSNKKIWVKQPTCTSAGSYYLACSDDNTRMTNNVSVPATGHS